MLETLRQKMVRQNRIYIMPSGRGVLFLAVIIVMILTAATYANNLIFILSFFMFAAFVVSMVQTHYNMKGVRVEFLSAEDSFEGDPQIAMFQVEQKRRRNKRALRVRTARSRLFTTVHSEPVDLNNNESARAVRIDVVGHRRGRHRLPEIIVETYFPLGLFRAWKVFRFPKAELIVYPKPDISHSLAPSSFAQGEDQLGLRTSPEGDFGELKEYRSGESYHQIAWKQYARTGDLYSKVHWGDEHKHYVIPWPKDPQDLERKLSRISGWIKRAVDENASFEMEIESAKIPVGEGLEHAKLCWRALAEVKSA